MSSDYNDQTEPDRDQTESKRLEDTRPLVSAADVNEANYPRARFDDGLAWTVKEVARRRAPRRLSVWTHQIGFAGELAAAAYFGVEANWVITDSYVGDDGYDFYVHGGRVEVKTVTGEDDWELKVPNDRLNTADYFVLARCTNPSELVELIGWAPDWALNAQGSQFGADNLVRLQPERLYPFEPIFLPPERIRATQEGHGT